MDQTGDTLGVCFELSIGFCDASTKKAVLLWLEDRGITDIVEGVIDGVDLVAPEDAELAALSLLGGEDMTPIAVYGSKAELEVLSTRLAQAFTQQLELRIMALANTAWQQAWQADGDYQGIASARLRVMVGQSPSLDQHDKRIQIGLMPGTAFGDGRHATTQVALELLDSLGDLTQAHVLDVGTGNGVLAIAAALLGAKSVVATEIEAEALSEAQINAEHNQVRHKIEFLLADHLPIERKFEIICANILVPVLHALMPEFAAAMSAQGVLVLAGFIEKDEPALLQCAAAYHMRVLHRSTVRGWLGLVLTRESCATSIT